jgi:ketosteroid isomerase-like protein
MSDLDDAARVAHRWIELYNDGSAESYGSDRFLEVYADDCAWYEMPTSLFPSGRSGGVPEVRAAYEHAASLLRDRRADLHDVVADGNEAAMRYTWSAVVAGDSPLGPAGTRLVLEVAAFLEVRNGRIVSLREYVSALRS